MVGALCDFLMRGWIDDVVEHEIDDVVEVVEVVEMELSIERRGGRGNEWWAEAVGVRALRQQTAVVAESVVSTSRAAKKNIFPPW